MSGGREWAVSLEVVCRVETCPTRDSVTVASVGAEDARQGVMKVLRYRGWTIDRRDDLCPAHSGPIRCCELCGAETPSPYGHGTHAKHITGVAWACEPCYRVRFNARLREPFATVMTDVPS